MTTTDALPPATSPTEDPDRKADLTEMQVVVLDEVEHLEIVDRMMGQNGCQLAGRDRRKLVVLRQVARVLQLLQAHEREFADLVRQQRKQGGKRHEDRSN